MALPTVTHTPANTVYGGRSFLVFTPSGVSPTPVEVISKMVDYTGDSELAQRLVPDAKGVMRPDRIVRKSAGESFTFETEELAKVTAILGGGLNGLATGTAVVFITDPDDAAGKVAIKSESFPCIVQRDGNVSFNDDFAKAKIKVTSTKVGDITFTLDGDA